MRKALSELESSVQILVITHLGPNGSEKQKRTMEKELLKRKKETLRSESNYLCPTMDVVPVTRQEGIALCILEMRKQSPWPVARMRTRSQVFCIQPSNFSWSPAARNGTLNMANLPLLNSLTIQQIFVKYQSHAICTSLFLFLPYG